MQILISVASGSGSRLAFRLRARRGPQVLDIACVLSDFTLQIVVVVLSLLMVLSETLSHTVLLLLKGVEALLDISKVSSSLVLMVAEVPLGRELIIHLLPKVITQLVDGVKELLQLVAAHAWVSRLSFSVAVVGLGPLHLKHFYFVLQLANRIVVVIQLELNYREIEVSNRNFRTEIR